MPSCDKLALWGNLDDGNGNIFGKNNIPVDITFVDISIGKEHICGITSNYQLVCWGNNRAGQCGINDEMIGGSAGDLDSTNSAYWMRKIPDSSRNQNQIFKDISCGYNYTCGITSTNDAVCWGENDDNQSGLYSTNSSLNQQYTANGVKDNTYKKINSVSGHYWSHGSAKKIKSNVNSSLIIDSTGKIQFWGDTSYSKTPIGTVGTSNVTDIAMGYNHTLSISGTNVYAWPTGACSKKVQLYQYGQSCVPPTPNSLGTPIKVSAGQYHSAIIYRKSDSSTILVMIGGVDEDKQLGLCGPLSERNGTAIGSYYWIKDFGGVDVVDVMCGALHTQALLDNGDIITWGNNEFGQCSTVCSEQYKYSTHTQDTACTIVATSSIGGYYWKKTVNSNNDFIPPLPDSALTEYSAAIPEPYPSPTITTVTVPATVGTTDVAYGPTTGNTSIIITGTGFSSGNTVTVNAVPATSVTVVNATTITALTPAGTVGKKDIVVSSTNNGCTYTTTKQNGFEYFTPPTISNMSPLTSYTTGGTAITITGTNLTNRLSITVGSVAGAFTGSESSTSAIFTSPVKSNGSYTATLTTKGGSVTSGQSIVYTTQTPTVSSIAPSKGILAGGTSVTITGTLFASGATVSIGGVSATGVTVVNSTTITATTESRSAGTVDVVVTSSGQSGTLTSGFEYTDAILPKITSINVSGGPVAGGTPFTITGTNFENISGVTLCGVAATGVTQSGGTSISGTTGVGSAGLGNLVVTTSVGSSTLQNSFTYYAIPTFSSINPVSGSISGATSITITGTNLIGTTGVTIDGTSVTSLNVVTATSITAQTPAKSAGAKTVVITTPGGTATSVDSFTYIGIPTISSITCDINANSSPASALGGGSTLTINGTNLSSSTVQIGTVILSSLLTNTATVITCNTPIETAGLKNIKVTTIGGNVVSSNAIKYIEKPSISSLSRNSGKQIGGEQITITGTDLSYSAGSVIDKINIHNSTTNTDTLVSSYVSKSNTEIIFNIPALASYPATTAIRVFSVGGQSDDENYTYYATPNVSTISPNNGQLNGGTPITITGTYLDNETTIKFGNVSMMNPTISSTSITGYSPRQTSAGVKSVCVTTLGGSHCINYTYNANSSSSSCAINASILEIVRIRLPQNSLDVSSYAELSGSPGTNLSSYFYIVINSSGVVENAIPLTGIIPDDGFSVLGWSDNISYDQLITSSKFSYNNNEHKTHMLVRNFTGSVGQNISAGSCTLQILWDDLGNGHNAGALSSVGFVYNEEGGTSGCVYSENKVGGLGNLPNMVYKCRQLSSSSSSSSVSSSSSSSSSVSSSSSGTDCRKNCCQGSFCCQGCFTGGTTGLRSYGKYGTTGSTLTNNGLNTQGLIGTLYTNVQSAGVNDQLSAVVKSDLSLAYHGYIVGTGVVPSEWTAPGSCLYVHVNNSTFPGMVVVRNDRTIEVALQTLPEAQLNDLAGYRSGHKIITSSRRINDDANEDFIQYLQLGSNNPGEAFVPVILDTDKSFDITTSFGTGNGGTYQITYNITGTGLPVKYIMFVAGTTTPGSGALCGGIGNTTLPIISIQPNHDGDGIALVGNDSLHQEITYYGRPSFNVGTPNCNSQSTWPGGTGPSASTTLTYLKSNKYPSYLDGRAHYFSIIQSSKNNPSDAYNYSAAIHNDGSLWCWGNFSNILGSEYQYDSTYNIHGWHYTTKGKKVWIKKYPDGTHMKFDDVMIGNDSMWAIEKTTGNIIGWGDNYWKQLGEDEDEVKMPYRQGLQGQELYYSYWRRNVNAFYLHQSHNDLFASIIL